MIALGKRKLIMIGEGHIDDFRASNDAPSLDIDGNYIVISFCNYLLNYTYTPTQFSVRMYISNIK